MNGKFVKLSRLEGLLLLLTVLFAAGTLGWFFAAPPRQGVVVSTVKDLPPAEAEDPAPGLLDGEVMDLNTASAEDLTRLPGIGPVKAEAIVAWRQEHGGFAAVEELLEVKGIGEATLEGLRPYVTAAPTAEEGGDHGTNFGGG